MAGCNPDEPQEGDPMSEQTPEPQQAEPAPPEGGEQAPETFDKEYVEKLRREAADYRTKLRAVEKSAEDQRKASMSEAERAIAEAENRGRLAAVGEYGKRLARSQFDALAAKRNPDADTAQILEYVDLGRFIGDDGEPDVKALTAAVERLVPAATSAAGATSFDGGARKPPPSQTSMSGLIRAAAGRS